MGRTKFLTGQITSEPFGLVMASVFQIERSGALSGVNSEVRPKLLDTADIVREVIYHQPHRRYDLCLCAPVMGLTGSALLEKGLV